MINTYLWSLAYVVIEEKKLCGDEGTNELMDEKDCEKTAEDMGLEFSGYLTLSEYPKGCFKVSKVYFNKHSVGSRRSSIQSICKNLGTT